MAALMYPVGAGDMRRRVGQANAKAQVTVHAAGERDALRLVKGSSRRSTGQVGRGDEASGARIVPLSSISRSDANRALGGRPTWSSGARTTAASITSLYQVDERVAAIHPLALAPRVENPDVLFEREIARRVAIRRRARLRRIQKRRLRAVSSVVTSVGILCAAWIGTTALSGLHAQAYRVLPGSVKTAGGYMYTVRAGDSIWSIATRLNPTGDPRPAADQIQKEVGGSYLQPGTHLIVP